MLDKEVDRDLVRVPWAQRVNISAHTGRAVAKLVPALDTALESWDKRIPTGRLNTWLKEVVAATPPPMRGGRLPRIMFATQASTRPPTFVLFTTGFLEAGGDVVIGECQGRHAARPGPFDERSRRQHAIRKMAVRVEIDQCFAACVHSGVRMIRAA